MIDQELAIKIRGLKKTYAAEGASPKRLLSKVLIFPFQKGLFLDFSDLMVLENRQPLILSPVLLIKLKDQLKSGALILIKIPEMPKPILVLYRKKCILTLILHHLKYWNFTPDITVFPSRKEDQWKFSGPCALRISAMLIPDFYPGE